MTRPITKAWTFTSDSSPDKTYETLQYDNGTTSCACPGWTRRVAADGTRSCKHTRLVDMGRADYVCIASKDYLSGPKSVPVKHTTPIESVPVKKHIPVIESVPVKHIPIVRKVSWR